MACRMGCSMIKKGVLGAALATGALYLVFGTSAPSYLKTAFHKVRSGAKGAVPVQFEIDRAREEIANLEPAIKDGIAQVCQARVEIEVLSREVATTRGNIEREHLTMRTLRDRLGSGDLQLAGASYTAEEIKADLARRLDTYRTTRSLVESREATLKAKQKTLAAAQDRLNQMAASKKALQAKIDNIDARLKMIQTTSESREFSFDDSALARAKETVSDLEKRLDVMALSAEMEGKYAGTGVPVTVEPGRDVVKEVDAELGRGTKKPGDKSL